MSTTCFSPSPAVRLLPNTFSGAGPLRRPVSDSERRYEAVTGRRTLFTPLLLCLFLLIFRFMPCRPLRCCGALNAADKVAEEDMSVGCEYKSSEKLPSHKSSAQLRTLKAASLLALLGQQQA
mmetsp:Transcript_7251/g.26675  ORF Transcript_7251/g.26675 Transcript_7251/m.26675 type:complete len:122 (-) Transcript_7251:69-434(-)